MSETAQSKKSLVGMKNIYMCQTCGHGFISQDVDGGVTPFSTTCLHPGCGGLACSFFYRAPQEMLARIPAAIEWYRPSAAENLSAATRAHVDQGGLISRPCARSAAAEVDTEAASSPDIGQREDKVDG